MFYLVLGGDFKDADPPVEFGLFADSKAVGVDEAGVDVFESRVQRGFGVAAWAGD